ncbi:hypothetical protein LJR296_003205 [Cupriavidus necator]
MTFALVVAAFFAGAGYMAYTRDKEAERRQREDWDHKREAEKHSREH